MGKKIRKICNDFHSTLIINDDPLLARNVKADGVHLGQEDMPYNVARNILGPDTIKGTLIPPSIASHFPLLNGKLILLL